MADDETDCLQEGQQEKYGKGCTLLSDCMADYFALYRWIRKEGSDVFVMYLKCECQHNAGGERTCM